MKKIIFTILGVVLSVISQSSLANSKLLTPEGVKDILANGNDTQIKSMATELNLVIPKRMTNGSTEDSVCDLFSADNIKITYVALAVSQKSAVVQANSANCGFSYLVIFNEDQSHTWHHVTTLPLFAKTQMPVVQFEEMISKGSHEIIVRDSQEDYGTGIQQLDVVIFKMIGQEMRVVFNEPSKVVFSVPLNDKTNSDQEETATFDFVDVKSNDESATALKEIQSKQVISDHKTNITRYWKYVWVPELRIFEKVSTLPSE